MQKYLVTSALPYANGDLHIGHIAGAYLPADIFVRYLRLKKNDVVFICGTDEHGAPISIQAEQKKVTPREIVDKYHKSIAEAFAGLNIEFDNFSGTSRPDHIKASQEFFLNLYNNGYIKKKTNDQFFCDSCDRFLADRYVEGTCPFCKKEGARGDQCDYCGKLMDTLNLQEPKCKICAQKPLIRQTAHWFLNLPAFQEELKDWLKTKQYWKDNILSFIMGMLEDGLKERAITRDIKWGVPVPLEDAEGKVLYVWFEAPIGYISSTVEWAKKIGEPDRWKDYWLDKETKLIHFIGKDNNVFHAIFWPAVLMGQRKGYVLPHDIPANEFLNLEGDKISTSKNWAIWVNEFLQDFDGELLRYYLAATAPESKDSDFSWKEFQDKNNVELANTLGNLINRVFSFTKKYFGGTVKKPQNLSERSKQCLQDVASVLQEIDQSYSSYKVRKAVRLSMDISRLGNRYFDEEKPWKTVKEDKNRAEETLYVCFCLIKDLSVVLYPVLPRKTMQLRSMLGNNQKPVWSEIIDRLDGSDKTDDEFTAENIRPLFPRIEDKIIKAELDKLYRRSNKKVIKHKDIIEYEDFDKMEIRVARVVNAEAIPKADKLLKLTVSLGEEERTVIAGIAKHYKPEALLNKKIVILVNLKPRKLFGYESQGMILAAEDEERIIILTPDEDIDPGSPVA